MLSRVLLQKTFRNSLILDVKSSEFNRIRWTRVRFDLITLPYQTSKFKESIYSAVPNMPKISKYPMTKISKYPMTNVGNFVFMHGYGGIKKTGNIGIFVVLHRKFTIDRLCDI